MNCVFLSVFSSVSSPSMWVIVSCKTLVINRDFWYAHSPKRHPEWRMALVSMWRPARSACFLFIYLFFVLLFVCSLIIRLSFCCPHSLNLDFSMHWFVFAWHLYVVFVVPSSNCTEWCIRCSVKPPLFLCLFGKGCQIKETSGLSALTCITSLPVLVLVVSCLCALFCRQNDFLFVCF